MYKNRMHFQNSGPNQSKLGSFVDKHHIIHVIVLKSYVTVIFAYAASFER